MADEQTTTPTTVPAAPSTPTQAPATPPAGVSPTETPAQEQTVPYARFKEINDKLKAIEDDNAKRAKAQVAEDEQKMAQQAEWQKLAEARKAKVEELAPKVELADKLTALVTAQYTAEIAAWPEQVRNMAPADDASILAKLEWANKARALATELMEDKTPVPGNGRRPRPVSQASTSRPEPAQQRRDTDSIYQPF